MLCNKDREGGGEMYIIGGTGGGGDPTCPRAVYCRSVHDDKVVLIRFYGL